MSTFLMTDLDGPPNKSYQLIRESLYIHKSNGSPSKFDQMLNSQAQKEFDPLSSCQKEILESEEEMSSDKN